LAAFAKEWSNKHTKVVYTERDRERGTRLKFVLFRPTPPSRGRVLYKQTLIQNATATADCGVGLSKTN